MGLLKRRGTSALQVHIIARKSQVLQNVTNVILKILYMIN